MFALKTNSNLSHQIRNLKQEYQHHPTMLQVKLLSFKLQQEKKQSRILYQSIKKQIGKTS